VTPEVVKNLAVVALHYSTLGLYALTLICLTSLTSTTKDSPRYQAAHQSDKEEGRRTEVVGVSGEGYFPLFLTVMVSILNS
jgi:hypothetical protein